MPISLFTLLCLFIYLEPVLKYNRAFFRSQTMNNCRHDTIPLLNDGVNLREHFVLITACDR